MAGRRFLVIEKGDRNYSSYAPDIPGCVATGATEEECLERMREAIQLHFEGLVEDGLPIPEPGSRHAYLDV